jgi:hypothetical protein
LPEDILAALRSAYRPAPGLRLHDWDEAVAVVFVAGTNTTHLVDATAASLIADWQQAVEPEQARLVADLLQAQIPSLLQAGILIQRAS